EEDAENPNREGGNRIQWASPTEFLLTCIGYSVGLGNVWRFPYLCYKNGGGAFLIPYVIMIICIGMPLLFMEYSFGQYFGVGSLSIFKKVCPMFQGIGIGYVTLNGLVCVYYNVIIAISLYYLFGSFTKTLPWGHCGNSWNTEFCKDVFEKPMALAGNQSGRLNAPPQRSFTFLSADFTTVATTVGLNATANVTHYSPSDEFFRHALLAMGDEHNVSNLGAVRWHLCLCLLLAWILVIIFVSRGIQSTGKVVAYFTATFPYVMLTVLVVRGVTLPGASQGILYFVTPKWEMLKSPDVWFAAATQLFYSTNLAWGGMITMSSYSKFTHNCYRDAIMINIVSFFTSLYAGFAVFSIIGFMANESGVPVDKVIDSGPGLAFVVYPRALSLMPLSQLWSALFFFMLFLLGIGSQMVLIETVVTGFVDEFPKLGLNRCIRFFTMVAVVVIFFLCGIPMTTQGGMWVLQLMDHYSAGFCVLVIAIVECMVINWIYGQCNDRMAANVKEMLGHHPKRWWLICWKYISPCIIMFILIFSFVRYSPAKYGDDFYPAWADVIGWFMSLASNVPILVVAVYKYVVADG
ncbi:hypothetical protein CAPTEDRAFT_82183, partial [Capitella teleta]